MTWWKWILFGCIDICLIAVGAWYYMMVYQAAPTMSSSLTEFTIAPGESPLSIFARLEAEQIIRSEYTMQLIFALYEDSTDIKAGTYQFAPDDDAYAVARTLVAGQFTNELLALTLIEGGRADTYGDVAEKTLTNFDRNTWDTITAGQEGLLFPDTYHVPPDYSANELYDLLTTTHNTVLQSLKEQYGTTTLSDTDVIILASILEREANDEESMRTVAGIFLNRLQIGMPLQADATIEYALDTPLHELRPGQLANELRELDSPYNTYKYAGLPPTPIGNPGRQAIAAVLNPLASDYLYYVTGEDGTFYYASTYNQHLINIERRLR